MTAGVLQRLIFPPFLSRLFRSSRYAHESPFRRAFTTPFERVRIMVFGEWLIQLNAPTCEQNLLYDLQRLTTVALII